ncbi:MAG: VWA domain-containing protein, partial [Gammaproteobacteria bacterium]|nr:VWA domain-containing protein [Gammaproteobacteria bacterium]
MLAEFHFLRPAWLLLLLPLAWLWWQLLRGRLQSGNWGRVVDAHLLPMLLTEDSRSRSRLAPHLLGLAWFILALALAGPAWQRLPQPVYQVQQYRVIALDLSLPMNVADLKPSRLGRARFAVIDLVKQMDEGQVALIGFGAEPYVVSPLTSDGATIIAQVPLLGTDLLPTNGPARADLALDLAGELLSQAGAKDGDVILLSNRVGELQRAVDAAGRLGKRGYRVSVVGIGDAAGGPLPLPNGGFAKNPRGEIVISKLETEPLVSVARAGTGRYVELLPGGQAIETLSPAPSNRTAAIDAASPDQPEADQWREAGPWLVLLLLPLAALAFRRGWIGPLALTAALLLPVPDAHALDWGSLWWRDDQRAMRQLQAGDPAGAATLFERNDWRAAAAYEAGDFDHALEALGQTAAAPEADNATPYNRGNALARLGRLDEAIAAYDEALDIASDDADARHNRDLVQRLLDRQREQNRQDQNQQDPNRQSNMQQSPEQSEAQSQGQSDSDQQGEQSQQDGQGSGQDVDRDSDARRDQQNAEREPAA